MEQQTGGESLAAEGSLWEGLALPSEEWFQMLHPLCWKEPGAVRGTYVQHFLTQLIYGHETMFGVKTDLLTLPRDLFVAWAVAKRLVVWMFQKDCWYLTWNPLEESRHSPFEEGVVVLEVMITGAGAGQVEVGVRGTPVAIDRAWRALERAVHVVPAEDEEEVLTVGVIRVKHEDQHLEVVQRPLMVDADQVGMSPELLDVFYGEGMRLWHTAFVERLGGMFREGRGHGLSILHGPPGGGKTSYIRYLIQELGDVCPVVLCTGGVLKALGTPQFVEFMLGLDPCVLLLEDAEDVLDGCSTILNVTDGLLGSLMEGGVHVLLTYNCPDSQVNPAMFRAGRLVAKRLFGPLSAGVADRLRGVVGVEGTGGGMLCDVLAGGNRLVPVPAQKGVGLFK